MMFDYFQKKRNSKCVRPNIKFVKKIKKDVIFYIRIVDNKINRKSDREVKITEKPE